MAKRRVCRENEANDGNVQKLNPGFALCEIQEESRRKVATFVKLIVSR